MCCRFDASGKNDVTPQFVGGWKNTNGDTWQTGDTAPTVVPNSQQVGTWIDVTLSPTDLAKVDPSKVETARKAVPSLQHGRRFSVADPKAGPEHLHLVRGSA